MKFLPFFCVFQCAIWQSCSYIFEATPLDLAQQQAKQVDKSNYSFNNPTAMQTEDGDRIMFEMTGTVTNIRIRDLSKKAGIKNFHTNLTVKVETTSPADVASQLPVNELSFSRQTEFEIDSKIAVGDKVTITVVGNNLSDPSWFRIYNMKKNVD